MRNVTALSVLAIIPSFRLPHLTIFFMFHLPSPQSLFSPCFFLASKRLLLQSDLGSTACPQHQLLMSIFPPQVVTLPVLLLLMDQWSDLENLCFLLLPAPQIKFHSSNPVSPPLLLEMREALFNKWKIFRNKTTNSFALTTATPSMST